jgi:hypothetical protein
MSPAGFVEKDLAATLGYESGYDKTPRLRGGFCAEKSRRRPTLPGGYPPSTIGADGLNCRVRNGNGCLSAAMATGNRALSGLQL